MGSIHFDTSSVRGSNLVPFPAVRITPFIVSLKTSRFLLLSYFNFTMIPVCDSCGIRTSEFTEIKCPKCGEKLIRCASCKSNMVTYTCKKCGFVGP